MKRYIELSILFKSSRLGMVSLLMPALPAIAIQLNIPSTQAKYIIIMLSVGLIIGHLYLTIFGDRLTFKKTLLLMTPIALIGSLLAFIPNIFILLVSAVLISFGFGVASTLTAAILNEGSKEAVTHKIGLVNAIAPWLSVVALIGSGYLVSYFGWIKILYVFVALSILIIIGTVITDFNKNPITTSTAKTWGHIKTILSTKSYIAYIIIFALIGGGLTAFFVSLPFLLVKNMHLNPEYFSFILVPGIVADMVGSYLSSVITNKISQRFFYCFNLLLLLLSIILLYAAYFFPHHIYLIILSMVSYMAMLGMIVSYTSSRVVLLFTQFMNTAIALMIIACNFFEIIFGAINSHLSDTSTLPLAIFFSVIFILVLLAICWLQPSKERANISTDLK